jgi:hypothetical protein
MTGASIAAARPRPGVLVLGVAVWVLSLVLLPAPLAARILLLAPLAIVPALLERLGLAYTTGRVAFLAALPLLAAIALPAGPLAAGLALPWLALALVAAARAAADGLARLRSIGQPNAIPMLGVDVSLGFWAVGAIFIVGHRSGVDLGFSPTIVLLTAVHFHFAGLGLLAIASLLARTSPWLAIPVVGLILGIPLTALGFVVASDELNAIGACIVGASGIGVAVGFLTTRRGGWMGWARTAAGFALLLGMPMGIAWSLGILLGGTFLDIDTMIRTHGILNSAAILLGVASLTVPEA